jgi:hypothetical protein
MVLDSRRSRLFLFGFVWDSLVVVECSINCFSPKDKWCLGVNHHGSCFLTDGLDHALGNVIHMVSVRRTWFIRCARSSEYQSEGLIVIFSAAIGASKLFPIVFHGANSGLK